jgi:PAS domain S-box-containing protein
MPWSNGTILVVDDESDALALLTKILTDDGHQVRPAGSGELALSSAAADPPELILLDLRMPDMDGLEVCRQLKVRKETRDIPVIFLSASIDRDKRVEGLALGAVDFIAKPYFRPELLARVRTHLELARLRSKMEVQIARRTEELVLTVKRLQWEIAERERTEQALRESEVRFRNMADTAPMMIMTLDGERSATFFNKEWLRFTGRTMEEELGKGWFAGVHPDDLESCLAGITASYQQQKECRMEFRLLRADGEYRSLLCKGIPRFAPDRTLDGYIASLVDITDLKQSQEAILARQKLESLGVLAGGIAHDFNNLLGTIMADAELLAGELGENGVVQESAKKIGAIAFRAAEIVRQLMTYAGQESTAFEPVDLAGLVREMLELVNVSISKRAVLKVHLPEKLPIIWANAAQMRQVVMNLVTNASEALEKKDGVIWINVTRTHTCAVPDLPEGDYLRLEVSDTGKGMTEETQARIFDPYFSTKAAGRGLGLAGVQGIIRSHRGTISVESTPGQGSSFIILLPASVESALSPQDDEASSSEARASGGLAGTILVVEDEDTLRAAVCKILRRSGITVFEASNGETAVELFRANTEIINVVLLDLTLPGMHGSEILRELRRMRPNVKVVITSAYSQDWALASAGEQQPWLYIRKPFHFRELAEVLRKAGLQHHGSRGGTAW